ncbi:MAG: hypothetical protein DWQ47_00765 [Acidobacteria bacterium]|mgnify:CR=1 FL=1|nr:MAG: hypothetical protein DWQ32_11225 [Acidobacteriota bacterium]REK04037.1 MAG: hypothetical protein DWQ38_00750 [Acidobacteriota bacterium]REK15199.1 MAG: hypothetical protein DWQ43_16915 [Acidobacteriota bacterium]REK46289.1 MAG: hypothetical protein DWQ47_00765 [Acidobacteriota bacterium]
MRPVSYTRNILIAFVLCAIGVAFSLSATAESQYQTKNTNDFLKIAEKKIAKQHGKSLLEACDIGDDLAAKTVFREYGAVFVAEGVTVPSECIFASEEEVAKFSCSLKTRTERVGGVTITLQTPAMDALLRAREEARKKGLSISPRGSSTAAARNFATTLRFWNSRFHPGLTYWTRRGKITAKEAADIKKAPVPQQVTQVLKWEQEGIYFARGFGKSILYSVAAPGASQHISMLALDVSQFGDARVRKILADHGWHRTVLSDLPHFTYLGVPESKLPDLGLEKKISGGQEFWVPEISTEK